MSAPTTRKVTTERRSATHPVVEAWPARANRAHNPYQALLSEALERRGWEVREFDALKSPFRRADVWHWHWPDGQFAHSGPLTSRLRSVALRSLLLWARIRRIPVVWTAHNLSNHEARNRAVERRFLDYFHRSISGVHYLSESTKADAEKQFPVLRSKYSVVAPHGHYRSVVTINDRTNARRALGLDPEARIMTFVGKIRRYKGVEQLVDSFREIPDPHIRLMIAGAVGDDSEAYLRCRAAEDDRITLLLRHLDDDELSQVLGASDVVVLPYVTISNSGSALLALSHDRPIVVPELGSLVELRDLVGADWVASYPPPLTAATLRDAVERFTHGPADHPDLEAFDWDTVSSALTAWYEAIRMPAPRGHA